MLGSDNPATIQLPLTSVTAIKVCAVSNGTGGTELLPQEQHVVPVLRALSELSDPRQPEQDCPAVGQAPLAVVVRDAQGNAYQVAIPLDRCGYYKTTVRKLLLEAANGTPPSGQ
jgi:hypothetical protein